MTIDKKEDKIGQRASNTATVTFNETEIPADNLLGEENNGFKLAMMTLDRTRPGVAAMAVGIGRAASSTWFTLAPPPSRCGSGPGRGMAGVADLPGLALAAVGRAPRHDLDDSMSIEAQNCGPIPVYVGLRSSRPSLPFFTS